jgi:hypothetical protein
MVDLDREETYLNDNQFFRFDLRDLPGSFTSPPPFPGPYRIEARGNSWWAGEILSSVLPLGDGTRLVLLGEGHEAESAPHSFTIGSSALADCFIPPHALAPYGYLHAGLHAGGAGDLAQTLERRLLAERAQLLPEIPTADNLAKELAWSCFDYQPIFVTSSRYRGLGPALQQLWTRIAKLPSFSAPPAAAEFLLLAFEARHEQADPYAVVILGDDPELTVAAEIVESRAGAVFRLPQAAGNDLEQALSYWYRLAWAAYYTALIQGSDPGDLELLAQLYTL